MYDPDNTHSSFIDNPGVGLGGTAQTADFGCMYDVSGSQSETQSGMEDFSAAFSD